MTKNRFWALPLAVIGGMAVGAAITLSRRSEHRRAKKEQHKEDLQTWEDEGGSTAPPATVPHHS